MSIKKDLIALGVKEEDIDNHRTDLYVRKMPVVDKYLEDYKFKSNVTTFVSELDGEVWYDIPFGYDYKREG